MAPTFCAKFSRSVSDFLWLYNREPSRAEPSRAEPSPELCPPGRVMRRLSGCRPGSPPESCHATPAGARRPNPSPTLDLAHVAARRPADGDDAGRRRHRSRERLTRPVAALARRAAAGLGALAALLLVSGLLAVPGGAARAQTGHWSAAMTVGNSGSSYGYTGIGTGYGALTTTGFTIAGTAYTVLGLVHSQTDGTGVNLLLDTALGADGEGLTLELDDSSFDFDDATATSVTIGGTGGTRYFWAASSPGWAAGDEVAARIAGPSPTQIRAPGAVPLASPTVTGIAVTSAPNRAKGYKENELIFVAVTFSEAVSVDKANGNPSLDVTIGTAVRQANHNSASSTLLQMHVFAIVVRLNEEDTNGVSVPANALAANGATFRNAGGEDAILTHTALPDQSDDKVDAVKPKFRGAEINSANPNMLVITFSESLDTGSVPPSSAFLVRFDGTDKDVTNVAISGSKVTLTLDATATIDDDVKFNYLETGAVLIQDLAGNRAGDIAPLRDVAWTMAQTVPGAPTGLAAEPGDAQVTLSWTSGGDGGSAITKHQYRQKTGSGSYGSWTDIPTSAAGETNATSFTVTTGLGNGTAYTFQVRAVNAQGDGTASGEASATPMAMASAPTVSSVAITSTPPDTAVPNDDTYAIGDKVEATVTFSEAVDVTGVPQLELQIGNDARQAAVFERRRLGGAGVLLHRGGERRGYRRHRGRCEQARPQRRHGRGGVGRPGRQPRPRRGGRRRRPQGRRRAADAGEREELWPTPHGNLDV